MHCLRLFLTRIGLCGSLLFAPLAHAAGADLKSASEADKATASEHYTQGMTSFQAGDASAALEQFQLSYQAVKSPNSHLMVGKALIDLGRYLEAHQVLEETLAEAKAAEALDPKYAQTRQAAEEELARVEQQVVRLSVSVSGVGSEAKVRVNDKEYEASELSTPIALAPGPLEVALLEDAEVVTSQTLNTTAGESLNLALAPEPPAEQAEPEASAPTESESAGKKPFRHRRETAYVAGGLGVLGAVTFGVFGLLNNSKFSDVEDSCNDNQCPNSARSDAELGHTYQTVANVGLVVGIVGLGTAVALILTEDEEAAETATQLRLGPGQVSLRGSF